MKTKSANSIDKHVGERVRMQREILKMSQRTLGNAVCVTFQQVQKYEKGVNRVGASRLQQLANVLRVPVAFFFEGAPQPSSGKRKKPPDDYVQKFLSTKDSLALTKAFMQIKEPKLRPRFVQLTQEIGDSTD
jgi:transcriptional regulator with XRE-family HTH domain